MRQPYVKDAFNEFLLVSNKEISESIKKVYIPICEDGLCIPFVKQFFKHWIVAEVSKETDKTGHVEWKATLYDPKPYLPWPFRSSRANILNGKIKHTKRQGFFNGVDCGRHVIRTIEVGCGLGEKPLDEIKQDAQKSFGETIKNNQAPNTNKQTKTAKNPFDVSAFQAVSKTAKSLFFFPIKAPLIPYRVLVSAMLSMPPRTVLSAVLSMLPKSTNTAKENSPLLPK